MPVQVLNGSAGSWAISNEVAYVKSHGIYDADTVVLVLNSGDLTQRFATVSSVADEMQVTRPSSAMEELYDYFLRPRFRRGLAREGKGKTDQIDEEAARQNIADLDVLARTVKEQRAMLAVIFIPFRVDIPDAASASEPMKLTSWTAANHVPSLDLTSSLSAYPTNQVTMDGKHLNTFGNHVVAEAIKKQWSQISH
jgi:hypothetical protein